MDKVNIFFSLKGVFYCISEDAIPISEVEMKILYILKHEFSY